MRRNPRPERLWEVDARPPALDPAAAGWRPRRGLRSRRDRGRPRRASAREPCLGRGLLLQEDVRGREPELRGALLRDDTGRDPRADPGDPRARRLPRWPWSGADGEPLARDAAEGRAGARAADCAGPPAPRRADDGARPALEAGGA